MTKCTINDYIEQVKALQDLGQKLVNDQYDKHDDITKMAPWVDEVEVMDIHIDCCLRALSEVAREGGYEMSNERKAMVDRVALVYGTTHVKTVRVATLCECYPNTEEYDCKVQEEYAALMNRGPFLDE